MFYDHFSELCKAKGISVTKATEEIGLARTIGTKWKNTGATPNGATLAKIADYFGVSVSYLLGEQEKPTPISEGEPMSEYARKVIELAPYAPDEVLKAFAAALESYVQGEGKK